MENMGKHEYMESMNAKTWMFFRLGKKKGFHTRTKKKKKKKKTLQEGLDRDSLDLYLWGFPLFFYLSWQNYLKKF